MTKRRRQTFFLDQAEFLGGAERFSLDFFRVLNPTEKRRLNLTVVGAEEPRYKANLPVGISVASFKFPSVSGSKFNQLLAVFKLLNQSRKFKTLINKEFSPQWVTNTPRGHFLLLLAKICWGLPGRWTAIFHDFTTRPPWLLRMIAVRANVLIANSLPTRKYLRDALPKEHHAKIRIIENGVDLTRVPQNTPPIDIKNVIHIGRIDPRKGQMHTAEAAALNLDLQFNIVGTSVVQDARTVAYDHAIQRFIKEKNITNFQFIGETESPFEEISKNDLLLALSTEPETFGRIATEGLACNKLVLAFDQTGPREILNGYHNWLIKQGEIPQNTPNPLIIKTNDSAALAKTIADFAAHPEKASVYTSRGREFIDSHYSLVETKKRLFDVLAT